MEGQAAGMSTSALGTTLAPSRYANPSATQSQWSFGWGSSSSTSFQPSNSKGFNCYHNQSSIVWEDCKKESKQEGPFTKTKKENVADSKPVWNYNPKTAGKTTMVLGEDKTDYRKKDEVYRQRATTTLTARTKGK